MNGLSMSSCKYVSLPEPETDKNGKKSPEVIDLMKGVWQKIFSLPKPESEKAPLLPRSSKLTPLLPAAPPTTPILDKGKKRSLTPNPISLTKRIFSPQKKQRSFQDLRKENALGDDPKNGDWAEIKSSRF